MPSETRAVVVGGGIAGLLSALLLKQKGYGVTIIEKDPACGGLLRSFQNPNGVSFDCGTHFLRDTGIPELDSLLFEGIRGNGEWHQFPYLKAGNYFQGILNEQNQFPDVRGLPKDLYEKGAAELLALGEPPARPENLKEHLEGTFGAALTEHLFAPALQKFFGTKLELLAPGVHTLFGLGRVVAFTPERTRELKQSSPLYDAKLAFHSFQEGLSEKNSYYPKEGGIGRYPGLLEERLKSMGVNIRAPETVEHVICQQGKVSGIRLGSYEELACDLLVWTIPAPLFAKASSVSFPFAAEPPRLRATTLHHLVFDSPFQTALFYLTCFDPRFSAFRVTLYPNIGAEPRKTPPYNCTVEVLSDAPDTPEEAARRIAKELQDMGIISPSSRLLWAESRSVGLGFPVLTKTFLEQSKRQQEFLQQSFKNTVFLGKVNTSSFFMDDVLRDTYLALR